MIVAQIVPKMAHLSEYRAVLAYPAPRVQIVLIRHERRVRQICVSGRMGSAYIILHRLYMADHMPPSAKG